jgi:hypothetical protein
VRTGALLRLGSLPGFVALVLLGCGARTDLSVEPSPPRGEEGGLDVVTAEASTGESVDSGGCLDRPPADCSCHGGACDQSDMLTNAIMEAVSACPLPCSRNKFWFDANGCATRYEGPGSWVDPCVVQALAQVRFACAIGAMEPVVVFNLAGSCGA